MHKVYLSDVLKLAIYGRITYFASQFRINKVLTAIAIKVYMFGLTQILLGKNDASILGSSIFVLNVILVKNFTAKNCAIFYQVLASVT